MLEWASEARDQPPEARIFIVWSASHLTRPTAAHCRHDSFHLRNDLTKPLGRRFGAIKPVRLENARLAMDSPARRVR